VECGSRHPQELCTLLAHDGRHRQLRGGVAELAPPLSEEQLRSCLAQQMPHVARWFSLLELSLHHPRVRPQATGHGPHSPRLTIDSQSQHLSQPLSSPGLRRRRRPSLPCPPSHTHSCQRRHAPADQLPLTRVPCRAVRVGWLCPCARARCLSLSLSLSARVCVRARGGRRSTPPAVGLAAAAPNPPAAPPPTSRLTCARRRR
jgi:hypothetical protein